MGKRMTTKEKILSILEARKGQLVSGEELAAQLSISRSAVWKAMRELRAAGHAIDASTKTGYCLRQESDQLSRGGILAALGCEAGTVAEHLFCYESLPSTNRLAKQLAVADGLREAIVVADSQVAGRGRYSHVFFSPAGTGLYMSFLLEPKALPFQNAAFLTIYAAVIVCEAIEALMGLSPEIKWVNDLYLNGKKICGILTEAGTDVETGQLQWMVCGIGINVREPEGGFPKDLPRAGALCSAGDNCEALQKTAQSVEETASTLNRNRLAAEIICRFRVGLCLQQTPVEAAETEVQLQQRAQATQAQLQLQSQQQPRAQLQPQFHPFTCAQIRSQPDILAAYRRRSFVLGREVEVLDLKEQPVCRAKAVDLDAEGRLIIQKADGTLQTLFSGEVHVRPEMD